MTNEEIESCIQTLRFLENTFLDDHGIFLNDKHPDNIEKIIAFLHESPCEDAVSCNYTTEEIAKSFIEDDESVKDQLDGQPCEDCISREETLNKINALIAEYIPLMPIGWTLPLNIAKTINEMPTVTLSRTRGKWITNKNEDAGEGFYICSNCKNDEYNITDFCPNCGADMKESEESE